MDGEKSTPLWTHLTACSQKNTAPGPSGKKKWMQKEFQAGLGPSLLPLFHLGFWTPALLMLEMWFHITDLEVEELQSIYSCKTASTHLIARDTS